MKATAFKNDPELQKVRRDEEAAEEGADVEKLNPQRPDERRRLMEQHPVRLRDYIVPTPSVIESTAQQLYLIDRRAPGATFAAKPRFGKTWAIKYLRLALAKLYPDRGVALVNANDHGVAKPTNSIADIAESLSLGCSKRITSQGLELVSNALFVLTSGSGRARHLVFIADEAHRWHADDLSGVLAVTNDLATRFKIRTTSFLWGQREMFHQRSLMLLSSRTDLLGRFLPMPFIFRGVSSLGELQEVLQAYDEKAEFPEGSGWTFTRFFFPLAYAAGFRLSSAAELLWNAFERASDSHSAQLELGMEWVSWAVENILIDNTDDDHPKWRATSEIVNAAVEATAFAGVVGTVYTPGEDISKPFPAGDAAARAGRAVRKGGAA